MNHSEIRARVLDVLARIAPDIEPGTIGADTDLREQMEIDSLDFVNFTAALHKSFGVEVPDSDFRELQTLDGCVAYLARRLNAAQDA
jgi:acyl carrier protein